MTKTRQGQGSHNKREDEGRVYLDSDKPDVCPVRTIMAYIGRKTEAQCEPKKPFLLSVKQSAEKNPQKDRFWFTGNRMGVNTIGKLYRSAFEEMGVDTKAMKITATSGRKQMVQSGAEAGVPGVVLSKMMGHAIPETKYNYYANRDATREAASIATSRRAMGDTDTDFQDVVKDLKTKGTKKSARKQKPVVVESSDESEEEIKAPLVKKRKNQIATVEQPQPSTSTLIPAPAPYQMMSPQGYPAHAR